MTPPPEFSEPRRSFVKKSLATLVVALPCLALVLLFWPINHRQVQPSGECDNNEVQSQGHSSGDRKGQESGKPNEVVRPEPVTGYGDKALRQATLERLKLSWASMAKYDGILDSTELDRKDALAVESIRLLLFSPELLELMRTWLYEICRDRRNEGA